MPTNHKVMDVKRTFPSSDQATVATQLVESLQKRFVDKLDTLAKRYNAPALQPIHWLRNKGKFGGGCRYASALSSVFNRASVNVSCIHYDEMPEKKLSSATALSTIIHPHNPHAPSAHIHISWTEMRTGKSYWRIMADLNPALHAKEEKQLFDTTLKNCAPALFDEAQAQGERYFYIPALQRHRGVSHFYLEGHHSGDFDADLSLAKNIGIAIIDRYIDIITRAIAANPAPDDKAYEKQLNYHSLYFLQVLTLDRGTTSGLLVHNENDVGILASLPSFVDRELLSSWVGSMPEPQDLLLTSIVEALPAKGPCAVTDEVRQNLAHIVRAHYQKYPEALHLQASGNIVPPTVDNHR